MVKNSRHRVEAGVSAAVEGVRLAPRFLSQKLKNRCHLVPFENNRAQQGRARTPCAPSGNTYWHSLRDVGSRVQPEGLKKISRAVDEGDPRNEFCKVPQPGRLPELGKEKVKKW